MMQILRIVEGTPAIVAPQLAWQLAVAIAVVKFMQMILSIHYRCLMNRMAFRIRCAVVAALFRKSTSLSTGGKATYSSGEIVNMMSNDANRCQNLMNQINNLWMLPINFTIALYLLVDLVGPAAFSGLALVGVVIPPLMTYWMKASQRIQKAKMAETDKRSRQITEIMSGIRIIKFMSWEQRFIDRVKETRDKEIKLQFKGQLLSAGLSAVYSTMPIAMLILILGIYGSSGGEFKPSIVFTALTLMDMVRGPLITISQVLNAILVDGKTAVDRITAFLNSNDWDDYVDASQYKKGQSTVVWKGVTLAHPHPEESIWKKTDSRETISAVVWSACVPKCIQRFLLWCYDTIFRCCCCCCCLRKSCCRKQPKANQDQDAKGDKANKEDDASSSDKLGQGTFDAPKDTNRGPCLFDINCEIHDGLTCIVGRVGSGKSSLILSILGEIDKVRGSISVRGKISYAAQSACVINATVKENILYGNDYDEARYRKVIKVCALKQDIKNLEAGDATQIGEKGISLSGGQRQRVGLARAVYADADIYILDDPLSAVDAHTGKHIFDKCIKGMLKNKTVILPTHSLSFLDQADSIIVLDDGVIAEHGSYSELLSHGKSFAKMMNDFAILETDPLDEELESSSDFAAVTELRNVLLSPGNEDGEDGPMSPISPADDDSPVKDGAGILMETEERVKGGVKSDVYWYYLKLGGWTMWFMVFCHLIKRSCGIFQNYTMSRWTVMDTSFVIGWNSNWGDMDMLKYYLTIYSMTALLNVTFGNITSVIICRIGLRIAKRLHEKLLSHVMKAPVK